MTDFIERYWRDATPADAIKEPPMVARFLSGKSEWFIGKLCGCWRDLHGDNPKWGDGSGLCHTTCQVYDAPDPGEGWRLIDTENEQPQYGDEFLGKDGVWIRKLSESNTGFSDEFIYRRRITPTVTYVPFTWEDREQLRGRWIVDRTGEQEYTIDDFLNDGGILYICGHPAEYFLNWTFLDTGKPVGKEVIQ